MQFGEEKAFEPIVWDGNEEYEEFENLGSVYYKIADYSAFSPEQIASITIRATVSGQVMEQTGTLEELGGATVEEHGWEAARGVFVGSDGQYKEFPEGVWFCSMGMYEYLAINPATTIKPMDEKYIPNTIARMSDVEALITGAIGGSY